MCNLLVFLLNFFEETPSFKFIFQDFNVLVISQFRWLISAEIKIT